MSAQWIGPFAANAATRHAQDEQLRAAVARCPDYPVMVPPSVRNSLALRESEERNLERAMLLAITSFRRPA